MKLFTKLFLTLGLVLLSFNVFATESYTFTIVGERATTEATGSVLKTTPINVPGFKNIGDCNAAITLLRNSQYSGNTTGQGTAKSSINAVCVTVVDSRKLVW